MSATRRPVTTATKAIRSPMEVSLGRLITGRGSQQGCLPNEDRTRSQVVLVVLGHFEDMGYHQAAIADAT
jgi:hypothetical protein